MERNVNEGESKREHARLRERVTAGARVKNNKLHMFCHPTVQLNADAYSCAVILSLRPNTL